MRTNSIHTTYPYGMLLPERNGNATEDEYRYAFNGMTADEEIKGERSNYDFGARMYDPRVGRWLSRDPISYRQSGQSPYKANGNNPIIYSDPDGKQEIIRITIKNSVTGESTTFLTFPKAGKDKVAAGGFYTQSGGWGDGATVQKFYDYVKDYTLTYNPNDGTIKFTYDGMSLIEENGVRARDRIWGKAYSPLTIVKLGWLDDAENRVIPGGMHLTSKDGGADPTKYKSKNAVSETLSDDLIALLGGMKGKANSNEYEKYKDFFEGVKRTRDLQDRMEDDNSSEVTPIKRPVNNNPNADDDTTITIDQYERHPGWTKNHSKDTVVKKSEAENVNTKREYNPKWK